MSDNNTHDGPSNRVPPLAPGSALTHACRLAEELRESDAAGYSMLETSVMALYFEIRRLRAALETILHGGYAPGADVASPNNEAEPCGGQRPPVGDPSEKGRR